MLLDRVISTCTYDEVLLHVVVSTYLHQCAVLLIGWVRKFGSVSDLGSMIRLKLTTCTWPLTTYYLTLTSPYYVDVEYDILRLKYGMQSVMYGVEILELH